MIDFGSFKALTFDCYGTLIDWDRGISDLVRPWLLEMQSAVPPDLVVSTFALMQARHQQVRPALLYPEVLRRTWRDIEEQFGWDESAERADEFAQSVGGWKRLPIRSRAFVISRVPAARHFIQRRQCLDLAHLEAA